jgi:hypothetical protein
MPIRKLPNLSPKFYITEGSEAAETVLTGSQQTMSQCTVDWFMSCEFHCTAWGMHFMTKRTQVLSTTTYASNPHPRYSPSHLPVQPATYKIRLLFDSSDITSD